LRCGAAAERHVEVVDEVHDRTTGRVSTGGLVQGSIGIPEERAVEASLSQPYPAEVKRCSRRRWSL
jgi:hypothetical protein